MAASPPPAANRHGRPDEAQCADGHCPRAARGALGEEHEGVERGADSSPAPGPSGRYRTVANAPRQRASSCRNIGGKSAGATPNGTQLGIFSRLGWGSAAATAQLDSLLTIS